MTWIHFKWSHLNTHVLQHLHIWNIHTYIYTYIYIHIYIHIYVCVNFHIPSQVPNFLYFLPHPMKLLYSGAPPSSLPDTFRLTRTIGIFKSEFLENNSSYNEYVLHFDISSATHRDNSHSGLQFAWMWHETASITTGESNGLELNKYIFLERSESFILLTYSSTQSTIFF